jgi:hypothetical protein
MTPKKTYLIGIFSLIIFFLSVFYFFASFSLFDSDFWWHVSTGRYIVTNRSLPDSDPFSFTSALDENKNLHPQRENFILKQYWLSQIIFYLLYKNAGAAGIILLRALLVTLTLIIVLWRLRRWSVSLPICFIFLSFLLTIIVRSIGERPVLFTILFTALTFFIIEDFKGKRDKRIFLLSPVMLLWSNLHGGFILGAVMIMVFMVGEGMKMVVNKSTYTKREIILFYTATIMALGFSFINPTGWDAFIITFSSKYKPFSKDIQEYQSPIFYFRYKVYPLLYGYVILALIFPLILILRNKRVDLTHIVLLSGLLFMSLSASRFIIYYSTIAVMVLGREVDTVLNGLLSGRISEKINSKLSSALIVACLVSSILFAVGIFKLEYFRFGIASGYSVPEKAADFMATNSLQGNIFNDYGYGGYITWRFYPLKKTFVDTRSLNLTVMAEYAWITDAVESLAGKKLAPGKIPLWERLLEHYDVNLILLAPFDVQGRIPRIIFKLTESNKWVPVYCDPISVIFIKNIDQNRRIISRAKLSKDIVYNTLIYATVLGAMTNKVNYVYLASIGQTFYKMGRLKDALVAYKYAMKRLPSPQILSEIDKIESELKTKGETYSQ